MVSGDLQSKHFPVSLHGVLISNLCALAVAATFLARFIALSRSGQTCYTYIKILFRALGNAGYTVGIAVNIDKDAIICDCIGTG